MYQHEEGSGKLRILVRFFQYRSIAHKFGSAMIVRFKRAHSKKK